jgi:hypothetical protein
MPLAVVDALFAGVAVFQDVSALGASRAPPRRMYREALVQGGSLSTRIGAAARHGWRSQRPLD